MKVRFQSPATQARYRSTFHAITTIVREERFLGLYKGIYSPLVRACSTRLYFSMISLADGAHLQASCALLNGIVFASYRFFLRLQLHHAGQVPTLTQIGLAGAGCGVVSAYVALSSVARTAEVTLKYVTTAPIVDSLPPPSNSSRFASNSHSNRSISEGLRPRLHLRLELWLPKYSKSAE